MQIIEKINIQLFSDGDNQETPTTNDNTTQSTDTSANTESDTTDNYKTYYDMRLIDMATPNLVHAQFAQKRPIPKNGGKHIEFRKFSSLPKASTALTEGVTPNGKSLTVSTVSSDVEQYGDFVVLSDMLELASLDNTVLETLKIIGKQAGLTLDGIVRDKINAGTNVYFCPSVSNGTATAVNQRSSLTANSKLTVDVVRRVVAKLRANNAPTIDGYYVGIIHPYVAYDLMSDPAWQNPHQYADPKNLYNGEIGEIAGVRFVETSEAKIFKGTASEPQNLAVFSTLIFGADAYGDTEILGGGLETIIKQKGSAGTGDPLNQRSSIGWKCTKTAELLVPEYLVRVESCSAYSSTAAAN